MSSRTIFLSRLIGLYLILVPLAMVTHTEATVATVSEVAGNPAEMLILGLTLLAAGLAMVLAHNVWSGGALPVVVTLIGWMSLAKGLFFVLLPPGVWAAALDAMRYRSLYPLFAGICIVIGLYLTYGGFKSASGVRLNPPANAAGILRHT